MMELFQPYQQIQAGYDAQWFEALFEAVDRLHDAASHGRLTCASPLEPEDMVGWLQDIIYTAQETISEIQANSLDASIDTGLLRLGSEANDVSA
ncbi:MAG: hypothetical protein GXY36_19595 [Chloroflexi bacterium]|jgi:gluconate kinase|nr:hypothetical protein [Chloroflexota bacterium]